MTTDMEKNETPEELSKVLKDEVASLQSSKGLLKRVECEHCGNIYHESWHCVSVECSKKRELEERRDYYRNPANYESIQKCISIPKRFIGAKSSDFPPGLEWPSFSKSIIVMGADTGTGKTHYLSAALTKWTMESSVGLKNVIFVNVPELMLELRASFNKKKGAETEDQIVKKYSEIDCLALDDFGAEKFTEFSLASIYLIINSRHAEMKPTFVSTNLDLEEIDAIDPRLASRFASYSQVFLKGKDRRLAE